MYDIKMPFTLSGLFQHQTITGTQVESVDVAAAIEVFEDRFRSLQEKIRGELIERCENTANIVNSLTLLPLKLRQEFSESIQKSCQDFLRNEVLMNFLFN